jgi:hypothetical protein
LTSGDALGVQDVHNGRVRHPSSTKPRQSFGNSDGQRRGAAKADTLGLLESERVPSLLCDELSLELSEDGVNTDIASPD